jgi:hypothetical protein
MVDVIQLPLQESPKPLTAQRGIRNLHEHFLAFLNANNPVKFEAEKISSIGEDAIIELLLFIGRNTQVSEKGLKRYATRIKRASDGSICHNQALDIVSRALGYAHWHEARLHRDGVRGTIRNRSNQERLRLRLFR